VEGGSWWWAQARLAVTHLGIRVRIEGVEKFFTILSRVTSKSAWFPFACMLYLLQQLDMTNIRSLSLWADGGTHFRTKTILTLLGHKLLHDYDNIQKTVCNFFCESHGKGPCDSHFGLLSRTRASAALKTALHEVEDLQVLYRQSFRDRVARNPGLPEEYYPIFMPEKRSLYTCKAIRLDSLPSLISTCYCWRFQRNDHRRKGVGLLGRGAMAHTLTGVTSRAAMLSHARCSADRTYFPVLESAVPVVELADIVPPAGGEGAPLDHQVREHLGWRTSYRTKMPESEDWHRMHSNLEVKFNALKDVPKPAATRRRSSVQVAAAAEARAAKRRKVPAAPA
jgi:hypothetical protein